ncbi:ABC transporter ATP-binding protein [Companilactobacillus bobalius]|uniref:Lacticin-481/lactococcin-DR transport/processing ATP-binding protein lcnDR3 n=2 Tax=Companilactobacillus bobalius TaxID=2801451 RepID=A0A202FEY4_9LACO|nr:ABC transporter ATP-binding protein [Companilactobacillus bobalius]KAE9560510.1 hypothetical protein ATN92_10180 [Companilactobacillus bobalius]KRK83273.1 ABC transporter ATP-binding protein [Companilactobacillus bobalius DSM 19674]OVE99035.1 Lacticin-481/lactococcin-DR transport/processing ATP-binding protein lcnDR3 [Companilactobacillus bobalius]GEO57011.1 ABC transporter ATP-binding protein [Companilactobacillus paralimentarius]
MNEVIRCKNISVKFRKKFLQLENNYALQDINFEIKTNEIFGIIGPSGAGKTTLLNVLTNQVSFKGELDIDGIPVEKNDKVFEQISLCAVDSGLYDELSVIDNLLLYANIFGKGPKKVKKLLRSAGLHDCQKIKMSKLSTGMKRRVSLIRCFLNNAGIVLLDEPTSNVDPITSKKIRNLIYKIKKSGKTVILTTHNMNEAENFCDHLILMNEGRIIEQGSPENIKNKFAGIKIEVTCFTFDNRSDIFVLPKQNSELADFILNNRIRSIHSNEPTLETVFIQSIEKRNISNEN